MTDKQKQVVEHLESLIHGRFNLETLQERLTDFFKEDIKLELREEDDISDWNYIFNSEKEDTYGYYDIYVLNMRSPGWDGSTFYVTEVSYEFE
jgi:uncharacterized protein YegJ (DUF2314 family)